MKKTSISILVLVALGVGAFFLFPKQEATCEDHKAADSGFPIPPMSPIPRPAEANLYIISPKAGDTVEGPITIQFGLKGMGVAPAGIYLGEEKPTGHHHLIIDADLPNLKLPFPMDDNYKHFGGGQTEVTVELPSGEHTLQLVLGDHAHIPHDPPLMSEQITITVK
tara:strand:+ start:2157 stop:2654 length:498 start_codon:yes stop_codon:yes gene_type:complete